MESIVSKCIEQLLDLIVIDHVENVGIEERSRSNRQGETSIAKDSYEVVNNFLLLIFSFYL
jgi:hypothetical protein